MPGSGDLQNLAQEFLDACVTALSDTPDGCPDRAFVSPGPPSWACCPQLTVHVGAPGAPQIADTFPLQPALAPTHRIARQFEVNMITMTATILRCDPTLDEEGALPDPAEMTATAATMNADMWAIWNYIRRAKNLDLLWGPREREVALAPAIAQKQQGGCCGWEIAVQVQLNGYMTSLLPPS